MKVEQQTCVNMMKLGKTNIEADIKDFKHTLKLENYGQIRSKVVLNRITNLPFLHEC